MCLIKLSAYLLTDSYNYRCNEIYNEIYNEITQQLDLRMRFSKNGLCPS